MRCSTKSFAPNTREAGVRDLERKIGRIMRKAARAIIRGEEKLEVP